MGIIVAIGGGEIGRQKILEDGTIKNYPVETLDIDNELIKLSEKKHPKMLILPTPSIDSPVYCQALENHYKGRLGLELSYLKLTEENITKEEIEKKINSADIIYVSGGDTRFALNLWKEKGVDKLLIQSFENNKILCGISAGAICWFDWYDNTDYQDEEKWNLDLLPGLGLINGLAIPHYDTLDKDTQENLYNLAKNRNIETWALDNCSAVVLKDGKISTISSQPEKQARKL